MPLNLSESLDDERSTAVLLFNGKKEEGFESKCDNSSALGRFRGSLVIYVMTLIISSFTFQIFA